MNCVKSASHRFPARITVSCADGWRTGQRYCPDHRPDYQSAAAGGWWAPENMGHISELEHAPTLIRRLSRDGIVCSMAHTAATIEQARVAVAAGARMVTHLFDTFLMPDFSDPGVYPAGLTDYLLTEDRLVCEIIPDGTHVHPLLVEKTFRCKPDNRLVFVTDSNNGAGLPPGEYELPRSWGRVRIDDRMTGCGWLNATMYFAAARLPRLTDSAMPSGCLVKVWPKPAVSVPPTRRSCWG